MFTPFADDSATVSIGDLSIENGTARIVLFGSLDLTRDRAGLERARALQRMIDAVAGELERANLSDQIAPQRTAVVEEVANPFG